MRSAKAAGLGKCAWEGDGPKLSSRMMEANEDVSVVLSSPSCSPQPAFLRAKHHAERIGTKGEQRECGVGLPRMRIAHTIWACRAAESGREGSSSSLSLPPASTATSLKALEFGAASKLFDTARRSSDHVRGRIANRSIRRHASRRVVGWSTPFDGGGRRENAGGPLGIRFVFWGEVQSHEHSRPGRRRADARRRRRRGEGA